MPPSSEVLCYRVLFHNLRRYNRASFHLFTSGLLDTLKRIYGIQGNIEDTPVDLGSYNDQLTSQKYQCISGICIVHDVIFLSPRLKIFCAAANS